MKELSLRQKVFNYMKDNPNTSNSAIQLKFNDNSANSVKTYRTQWLKKNKLPSPKKGKESIVEKKLKELVEAVKYTKVNEETIEKTLLELVNMRAIDAGLVRCMIDFFVKIKGRTDEIEDKIDMEALKEIGINITSSS
ncbi:hypothetical protein LCGC14_1368140 [marine sediment metagenome]|uniref:Uncharacterized protein n=1 Tax=marine sediment metagenome TaxID=412755 RepID=A0A0F9KS43_9ZZZZ